MIKRLLPHAIIVAFVFLAGSAVAVPVPIGVPALPAGAGVPAVPVGVPAVPAWYGSLGGVEHVVRDGNVVERLDGLPVEPGVQDEILQAKRVSDWVDANPELVSRVYERQAFAEDLLAQAQGVAASAGIVSEALASIDAGLVGSLVGGSAPSVDADDVLRPVHDLEAQLASLRSQAQSVSAASADASAALDAFQATHSVEDKAAVLQSFVAAADAYESAAAQVDVAASVAEEASATVDGGVQSLLGQVEGLVGGLLADAGVVSELEAAASSFLGVASDLGIDADLLRLDASELRAAAFEPVEGGIPVGFIVGGGLGAASAGLGGLGFWLRRRAGVL